MSSHSNMAPSPQPPAASPTRPIVPARRRRQPATLSRVCCARCAQYLLKGGDPCDKTAIRKCWRCQAARKRCLPIPASCIPRVNALIEDAERVSSTDTEAQEALRSRLAALVADIQQTNRVVERASGVSTPTSRASDATMLLIHEMRLMRRSFNRFLALYCEANNIPPFEDDGEVEGMEGVSPL
ncbi:uncharacterized protein PV09_09767 [Verruconis gallopava]|uniref:Uncharacterized protein n=1 Tax=Verruconis gallopava TaxID=253628 RepID=A0A0D2AHI9_9PEZI|nr:uncharacterized protein PV09_09767 [Verruconis gallopava]KIV98398.1 hypothetical protein PV09_09767 [Verruconis gallopava]